MLIIYPMSVELFLFLKSICECVCIMYMHVFMSEYVPVCMQGSEVVVGYVPSLLHVLSVQTGSFSESVITYWLDWLGRGLQGSACLCLPQTVITGVYHHSRLRVTDVHHHIQLGITDVHHHSYL